MIRNIFKERKERKVEELERQSQYSAQKSSLIDKMRRVLADKREYDTTYVIYSSEFTRLSHYDVLVPVEATCNLCGFTYNTQIYPDGFVFYIYVKKREDPKYEVGDVYHQEETEIGRPSDLMILGRSYDGKGRYVYATAISFGPLRLDNSKIEWRYLD